jgi:hypothetical protein
MRLYVHSDGKEFQPMHKLAAKELFVNTVLHIQFEEWRPSTTASKQNRYQIYIV